MLDITDYMSNLDWTTEEIKAYIKTIDEKRLLKIADEFKRHPVELAREIENLRSNVNRLEVEVKDKKSALKYLKTVYLDIRDRPLVQLSLKIESLWKNIRSLRLRNPFTHDERLRL
tara:strand:- start:3787 stop:4134 length:348 start_codon:yes stop_codon:yes gene_type:complete